MIGRHPKARKPPKRKAWMKRGGKIKPKKRTASEFARIYGSKARVEFMKSMLCSVFSYHCTGPIENAHTANGGMGRKGDAATIVPMCRGHHVELHDHGTETFQRRHCVDLAARAAEIEALWQRYRARWEARENAVEFSALQEVGFATMRGNMKKRARVS